MIQNEKSNFPLPISTDEEIDKESLINKHGKLTYKQAIDLFISNLPAHEQFVTVLKIFKKSKI